MKSKNSVFSRGRYAFAAVVVLAAAAVVFSYTVFPVRAQEQSPAAAQQDQPQAAPTEKPAELEAEEQTAEPAEEEQAAEEEGGGDLENEYCIDCHNPDILEMSPEDLADQVEVGDKPQPAKPQPPFVFGELKLSIDLEKYNESVHMDMMCIDCHTDIGEIPHKQRLEPVDCANCHDYEVETVQAGAHGEKVSDRAPGCIGCHDVHYSQGVGEYEEQWKQELCVKCHTAYGMDTEAAHADLYEYQLHLNALGCMKCHQGEEAGVHAVPPVEEKVVSCFACHNRRTILAAEEAPSMPASAYWLQSGFINKDVMAEYGYVIGAHRIPLLDLIVIIAVIAPLGLPIVHGGLRILTRRKEPPELPEEKILLHPLVERIWHWVQALSIVMLIITGVVLHWPEWFGTGWFDWAVTWHNLFGWVAVISWLLWLLYNLGTGRIKHYIPKKGDIPGGMVKQARFYGYGIFKHEPHPHAPSEDDKFNPLQKIAYLKFQLILFPILLISGLLYMYPMTFQGVIQAIGGMTVLAIIHYILAALFTAFLVAHLYLGTTGETVGENFKAIITGYGIKAEHHDDHA